MSVRSFCFPSPTHPLTTVHDRCHQPPLSTATAIPNFLCQPLFAPSLTEIPAVSLTFASPLCASLVLACFPLPIPPSLHVSPSCFVTRPYALHVITLYASSTLPSCQPRMSAYFIRCRHSYLISSTSPEPHQTTSQYPRLLHFSAEPYLIPMLICCCSFFPGILLQWSGIACVEHS